MDKRDTGRETGATEDQALGAAADGHDEEDEGERDAQGPEEDAGPHFGGAEVGVCVVLVGCRVHDTSGDLSCYWVAGLPHRSSSPARWEHGDWRLKRGSPGGGPGPVSFGTG